ncbi:hypothetical protein [Hymenobacter terrenus]|uniref:hypothetical protein n=1 Tax=Hymenobacter terrenus TaxID=1629124 RepID=UPI0006198B03|nr:hypothetical protein [Hymenobacter terrenus]
MSELQDYEAKDRILRYLVTKWKADPEHIPIASSTVAAEALSGIHEQAAYFSNTDPLVELHPRSVNITDYWVALKATAVTESFMQQDGFTRAFQQQTPKEAEETSDKALERAI